jgi:hypothetical protein
MAPRSALLFGLLLLGPVPTAEPAAESVESAAEAEAVPVVATVAIQTLERRQPALHIAALPLKSMPSQVTTPASCHGPPPRRARPRRVLQR